MNTEHIKLIIKQAEEKAGQWNGDECGICEDDAHTANEIIEKCNELLELIESLH